MASKNLLRYGSLTVAGAVLAFLLGANAPLGKLIWPAATMDAEPTSGQLVGFMLYGAYEAIAFGLGLVVVTQLVLALRRNQRPPRGAIAASISLAWLLLSWVPHDNLHQMVGMDLAGLLALEWVFHSTLILATFVVARFVHQQIRAAHHPTASPQPARTDRAAVKG